MKQIVTLQSDTEVLKVEVSAAVAGRIKKLLLVEGTEVLPPPELIRYLRILRGWSQMDLAGKLGMVNPSAVSKYETGIGGIGTFTAQKLAEIFEVDFTLFVHKVSGIRRVKEKRFIVSRQ